jgi:RNA polymerase sigma factor for flagellar operon FliA
MSRMKASAAKINVVPSVPAQKMRGAVAGATGGGRVAAAVPRLAQVSAEGKLPMIAGKVGAAKPAPAPKPKRKVSAQTAVTREEFESVPNLELWKEYRATSRVEIRNYFWEKYLPLVRYIAEKTYTRLPDEVDVNDLMSAGQFGLMDAIDAFDLDKGVKFETYSATRIKGAIIDELRAMDWVPRLVRSRTARVGTVRDQFEMKHGRSPTDDEVSSALGASGEELQKILKDSGAVMTVSLNRKAFNSDGNKEVTEIDVIRDTTQSSPLLDTQRRDVKELITKGLSRAERLIVTLYYYEELTMKEIGATLDLSESRVSQMHSSILARLKAQLQHRTTELEPDEER